jgi:UDP-N-acetylglucosamine diphosphorylase / glucose-1-phosphate thymidylyltransferase / UDP-N-acetylgalactosamine diphosphorylase / glucosamine-1-phosphate N-acetyltransferase / galactosamine-1-phosphate N-acetyltransferase
MQAVILAAGRSTRTYPLTLTRPKPLLKVANKTILEYNLEAIKGIVDEIIMVVGYKMDMIKDFVKKNYPELNITFVQQKLQLGTGHAVSILEGIVKGRFILLMGDNIYSKGDVKNIVKYKYSILVKKVKNPELFGVVEEKNGALVNIIEKPKDFISDLVSCAMYSFDEEIFNALKKVNKSKRGEYEITDAIKDLSSQEKINCIRSTGCFQISFPWDLLEVDKELRKGKNIVGISSKINGEVINSTVGDNCVINGKVKSSIIMDNVSVDKNSLIEDSIVGKNVKFSGIIISGTNIYSIVKNKKVKVDKLGAVIGDNVKASNVEIGPGSKIWPDKIIGGKIKNDIK